MKVINRETNNQSLILVLLVLIINVLSLTFIFLTLSSRHITIALEMCIREDYIISIALLPTMLLINITLNQHEIHKELFICVLRYVLRWLI